MTDTLGLLFIVNIALLATHELDAMLHHEWRLFFFLKPFSDVTAMRIFVALHVPLFALIIALAPERGFQIAFDLFLIIHTGLHIGLRGLPGYTFNRFSNVWIVGAGVGGALHLILLLIG